MTKITLENNPGYNTITSVVCQLIYICRDETLSQQTLKSLSTGAEVAITVKYFLASCNKRGNVPDLVSQESIGSADSGRQACDRYLSISAHLGFLVLAVKWFWFMKPNNLRRLVRQSAVDETILEGDSTCGLSRLVL